MRKSMITAAVLAISAGLGASLAFAQGTDAPAAAPAPAEAAPSERLSLATVAARFEEQGYRVTEIELDDGVYELEGLDSQGMRVKAHVDPATGEVIRSRKDDR